MSKTGNPKGAGRKKGSIKKPRIIDYLNEAEIKKIIQVAKDKALEGDPTVLKLILEQVFGKAPQSVELGGPDGQPITVNLVQYDK